MKKEEQIIFDYLESCGFTDIEYEPDGNIPPDFALNKEIGVEVRTLNQNYFKHSDIIGIEQADFRLQRGIKGVLEEFSMKRSVNCYWIALQFKRPIGNLKTIKNLTKKELQTFLRMRPNTPYEINISSNIQLTIANGERKNRQRFRIGLVSDFDSGGWIIPLYIENINHCIEEKTRKIQAYQPNYKKWWLILVDYLYGISNIDIPEVISNINMTNEWERVIIVNPANKRKIFEIK